MTAAVMKTVASAKPAFGKPSQAMLARIEMVLTIALLAQMVGLAVRYTV